MNNIAQQRKKIGISQAVLAEALGWGQSRIANYELNIRTPGLNDCREIVEALKKLGCKCTLDEVFPPDSITTSISQPTTKSSVIDCLTLSKPTKSASVKSANWLIPLLPRISTDFAPT